MVGAGQEGEGVEGPEDVEELVGGEEEDGEACGEGRRCLVERGWLAEVQWVVVVDVARCGKGRRVVSVRRALPVVLVVVALSAEAERREIATERRGMMAHSIVSICPPSWLVVVVA